VLPRLSLNADVGDQMQEENKQGIDRRILFSMYLGTYIGIVILFCLVMSGGHAQTRGNDLPMVLAMFPLGLAFFLSGSGSMSMVPVVAAYALYVAVVIIGIVKQSIKVYLIFVLLMLINIAGCLRSL
jgi:hypothetical protein